MADTEDVAKVLFKWITGEEYRPTMYMDDLQPEELVNRLEQLSIRYRIGIEDARMLLRNKEDEGRSMYTFGLKLIGIGREEYMTITISGTSEKQAKANALSVLHGNFQDWSVAFYTDLDAWKREANPEMINGN